MLDNSGGNVSKLPSYTALLAVDMKNFSGERGRDQARLTERIPAILHQSFHRCGLANLWDEIRFQGSTGDGYFLGFHSGWLPFLLNPLLTELQEELAYQNSVSSQTVRMRASVNVGPMTDSGTGSISDGSGDSRIETHRLLDAPAVRDLLDRSTAVTCVAAIVSARAYEDAVLSGYSDENPELYVPAPVQVKTYQGTAYLRVPRPSGELLSSGFLLNNPFSPDDAEGNGAGGANRSAAGRTTHTQRGDIAQDGGRIKSEVDASGHSQVTQVRGSQHNGPHYEGPQDHSGSDHSDHRIAVEGASQFSINQYHGNQR